MLCRVCEGRGYVVGTVPGHDSRCEGDCRNCPVPVPDFVECKHCVDGVVPDCQEEEP